MLNFVEIILIALGLSMDSFAVSLAAGTSEIVLGRRAALRLAFHLALFQSVFPIIGWSVGILIEPVIAPFDHWIAFMLLLLIAIRMIRSGLSDDQEMNRDDPTRGLSLIMFSIATSIDALSVGLGLAMLGISIWIPSIVIGVITFAVSEIGINAGSRLGLLFGKRMQVLGGVILLIIGIRIVVTHTV